MVKPVDRRELQQKQPWAARGSWVPLQEAMNRPGSVFDPSPPPELFCPVPTAASCPRSLDCALQRREFCPPGSGACGPCLPPFQEDDRGRCVQKQLSPNGRCTHPAPLCLHTYLHTYPAALGGSVPQGSPPPQQYPVLFLLSMAAVSLWGWLLFSLSPQLGVWFWAGNPIQLYVRLPLMTACIPISTVASPGPPRTGVGQTASGDLRGLLGFAGAEEPLSAHRAVTYAGSVGD